MFEIVAVVLILFGVLTAAIIVPRVRKARAERAKFVQDARRHYAERTQREAAWKSRLLSLGKKHLLGETWMDPTGKKDIWEALSGELEGDYLWFWFEDGVPDGFLLRPLFRGRAMGDVEVHGDGTKLRLRDFGTFIPELDLGDGRSAPLIQIGYSYTGSSWTGVVHFPSLFKEMSAL